jgi:hypothetical protein
VAIARPPHKISDQKISFLALLLAAYRCTGYLKKEITEKKTAEPSNDETDGVMFRSFAIPPAAAKPKLARSR